ncbi:hypothetical protein GA0061101_1367 [Rhizobium lusitanum]|uniref:Uncharacterized protein n=1 Tax=Rhizobium lusitanum TaxID=293958 RepID=A0A1C3XFN5_9HYPH|nr:hypothetical protein GA0061101_1367 [Rhizobium lusitanum]
MNDYVCHIATLWFEYSVQLRFAVMTKFLVAAYAAIFLSLASHNLSMSIPNRVSDSFRGA